MVFGFSNNRHVIDEALNELAAGLQSCVVKRTSVVVDADPSTLIRLMLDRWDDAFYADLGYRVKNLLYEIRDIRNDWAHNSRSFDDDDTDRALDSIERLLDAIDATAEAGRLRQVKDDSRRARYMHSARMRRSTESQTVANVTANKPPTNWDAFARYLREMRRMGDTTIRSRVSNCKRVAQFEGDLDDHFDRDECRNLLNRLAYSSRDQNLGLKTKHGIPINGDIRTGSATLKQAVSLYVQYRQHRGE